MEECNVSRIVLRQSVGSERQSAEAERHRQQPGEHQHGRLQGEHGAVLATSSASRSAARARTRCRSASASAIGSISPNFTQGGVESTGIATNVAIQGNGFFVVGDSAHRAYTRAGNFSFDAERHARDAGRPARAGLHRRSIRSPGRSTRRASRATSSCRRACCARRWRRRSFGTVRTSTRARPSARRSRVGADLRLARRRRTSRR